MSMSNSMTMASDSSSSPESSSSSPDSSSSSPDSSSSSPDSSSSLPDSSSSSPESSLSSPESSDPSSSSSLPSFSPSSSSSSSSEPSTYFSTISSDTAVLVPAQFMAFTPNTICVAHLEVLVIGQILTARSLSYTVSLLSAAQVNVIVPQELDTYVSGGVTMRNLSPTSTPKSLALPSMFTCLYHDPPSVKFGTELTRTQSPSAIIAKCVCLIFKLQWYLIKFDKC